MKKFMLLFISFLLINLMFFSCQQSGNPKTTLSGTIKGIEADSVKITYYKNDTWESLENLWIPLDSTGRFTVILPVNSLKEFRMLQSRVVLKPGWKTTINIFMNGVGEMDSTTFEGDGAGENEVYNNNLNLIFDSYNHINKEPGEFIAFLDSIDQVMKADVGRLKDADQEFVNMLRNNIAYHKMDCWEYYIKQLDYAGMERPDLLKEYSSQFDNLMVFDHAELLNSFIYKDMVENHFNEMARDSIDFDALLKADNGDREKTRKDYNRIYFTLMLNLADSLIPNPRIKSFIYQTAFNYALLRNVDTHLIQLLKQNYAGRFQEVVKDTSIINYIANQIDHFDKLSPGMTAPAFSFPDTTGSLVNLTDFKGKYVYIDVWATWCVPCIREFPKLKELEEAFGDEIAFVSISVDMEKERWHKYVKEKELTGIQILSHGSGKAEIMNLYMIKAIPRFIMIDPEGKIVNVDASKPSDDKTRKLFEEWTGREVVDS